MAVMKDAVGKENNPIHFAVGEEYFDKLGTAIAAGWLLGNTCKGGREVILFIVNNPTALLFPDCYIFIFKENINSPFNFRPPGIIMSRHYPGF